MRSRAWYRRLLLGGAAGLLLGAPAAAQSRPAYRPVDFDLLGGYDPKLPDALTPGPRPTTVPIPASVRALDNMRVAVRGYVLPLDLDDRGTTRFLLNATYDMCVFVVPARLNDWIEVRMPEGKSLRLTHDPVVAMGALSVGERLENGRVVSLYRMQADFAAPVPPGMRLP